MIKLIAQEVGKLPNTVAIEGHTDSKPYPPSAVYTNWELSADRANAGRRLMQANGFREDQVTQVRGFADQRLRKSDSPQDPSNRRTSFIVQHISKPTEEEPSVVDQESKGETKPTKSTTAPPVNEKRP